MATSMTEIDGVEMQQFTQDTEDVGVSHTWDVSKNADGKLRVVLPNFDKREEVKAFIAALQPYEDTFGVKKLRQSCDRVLAHQRLIDNFMKAVQTSSNTINGVRSEINEDTHKERIARRYFDSLSNRGIEHQCKVYGIDRTAYENVEDIIDALVEKHMQMF